MGLSVQERALGLLDEGRGHLQREGRSRGTPSWKWADEVGKFLREVEDEKLTDALAAEFRQFEGDPGLLEAVVGVLREKGVLSSIPVPCSEKSEIFYRKDGDPEWVGLTASWEGSASAISIPLSKDARCPFPLEFLDSIPKGPCVYAFREELGGVLYVGATKSFPVRFRQHWGSPFKREAIASVSILPYGDEDVAFKEEQELIQELLPPYNSESKTGFKYWGSY